MFQRWFPLISSGRVHTLVLFVGLPCMFDRVVLGFLQFGGFFRIEACVSFDLWVFVLLVRFRLLWYFLDFFLCTCLLRIGISRGALRLVFLSFRVFPRWFWPWVLVWQVKLFELLLRTVTTKSFTNSFISVRNVYKYDACHILFMTRVMTGKSPIRRSFSPNLSLLSRQDTVRQENARWER